MEALYSKLYDRYTKLKTKKWSEVDEFNRDQEVKFLNHLNAADELIEHLRSENNRLFGEVNDLRSEVASIRSSQHEEYTEYQKLLMEEKQKNKELLEEIERLQNLQQEGLCCRRKNDKAEDGQPDISGSTTRKRLRQSGLETEGAVGVSASDRFEHAPVVDFANHPSEQRINSEDHRDTHQPQCCARKIGSSGGGAGVSGPSNCIFHELFECLVGLKLSSVIQTDSICISALHQSSGYSFSLTWISKCGEEESELLYQASSLGTFERVAPEWMKEVLMFSMRMCPVFFERVSRVIKHH